MWMATSWVTTPMAIAPMRGLLQSRHARLSSSSARTWSKGPGLCERGERRGRCVWAGQRLAQDDIGFRTCRVTTSAPMRTLPWRYACFSSNSVRASRQVPDLCEWVEKQGGYVSPGLRIAEDGVGSGLGLVATERCSQGETIITLPSHLPMSLPARSSRDLLPSDASLLNLVKRVPEELWALRLGLKLLSEKAKESSFWWPYICHLPQWYPLPIFFSGDDIQNLQYLPLIHQVKKRCQFLSQLAREIPPTLKNLSLEQHPFRGQDIDAGNLGWAMSAVSSRAFQVPWSKSRLLLPLIDMCNHSFTPNARLEQIPSLDNREYKTQVVLEYTLEAGMPISLNYGPLGNDCLLLDYGFIVPENPHERIGLRFDGILLDCARFGAGLTSYGPASFESPAPWQQAILAQLHLQGEQASLEVTLGGPDLVESRLLAALRILYADNSSQLQNQDLEKLHKWGSSPLGIKNEQNVLRTLLSLSRICIRNFPTTIEDDTSLLASLDLSEYERVVIEFRLNKKQLLLKLINGFQEKLNALIILEASDGQEPKSKRGKGFR